MDIVRVVSMTELNECEWLQFIVPQAMKRVVHTEELFKLTKTSLRGTVQYMGEGLPRSKLSI